MPHAALMVRPIDIACVVESCHLDITQEGLEMQSALVKIAFDSTVKVAAAGSKTRSCLQIAILF